VLIYEILSGFGSKFISVIFSTALFSFYFFLDLELADYNLGFKLFFCCEISELTSLRGFES